MVSFKGCPRCRGDVRAVQDIYGEYRQCIQCGYVDDVVIAERAVDSRMGRQKAGRPRKRSRRRHAA